MRGRNRVEQIDAAIRETAVPPPKQFIMYDQDEDEPTRLWTMARLEEATIDKIAKRVVDLLAQNERDVLDMNPPKKRRKK